MTSKEVEAARKAMKVEKAKKAEEKLAAMREKGKITLEDFEENSVSLKEMEEALKTRFEGTLVSVDPPKCDRSPSCYAHEEEYTINIVRGAFDGPSKGIFSIDPDSSWDEQLDWHVATTNFSGCKTSILDTVHMDEDEKEEIEQCYDDIDATIDLLREQQAALAKKVDGIISANFAVWEAEGLGK